MVLAFAFPHVNSNVLLALAQALSHNGIKCTNVIAPCTQNETETRHTMDKSLKKLSRIELLQLLLKVTETNEALIAENDALRQTSTSKEPPKMKYAQSAKVGSIAEAALQANGYFEAAQGAADDYLREIKQLRDELVARANASARQMPAQAAALSGQMSPQAAQRSRERMQAQAEAYARDVQAYADNVIARANEHASQIVTGAQAKADAIVAKANKDAQVILARAEVQAGANKAGSVASGGLGNAGATTSGARMGASAAHEARTTGASGQSGAAYDRGNTPQHRGGLASRAFSSSDTPRRGRHSKLASGALL